MARYPSDDDWWIRALRFVNVLDDSDNKLSPTKLNVWSANAAGFITTAVAVGSWVANRSLDGVTQLSAVVGPYWAGSHGLHQLDKRLNRNGGNGNGH